MAFPEWLADVKQSIQQILSLTTDCDALCQGLLRSARDCRASAVAYSGECAMDEGRGGGLHRCCNKAGDSLKELFELYFEIEITAAWDFVLQQAGLDPNHVIEPIDGSVGGGYTYHFGQIGPLVISSAPGSAADVIASGQSGFTLPFDLKVLSRDMAGTLGMTLDFITRGISPAIVSVGVARPPRLVSADTIAHSLRTEIEDRAEATTRASLGRIQIMTPTLDILPIRPLFWGAINDSYIRIIGRIFGRAKGRRQLLAQLPPGFPLATRFDTRVITSIITDQVQSLGVQLFSGPTVTGPKTFVLVAGMQATYSIKIGCDVASATVTVKITIQGMLSVRLGKVLYIDAQAVGSPDVDVDIHPRIPILTDWADREVAKIIQSLLPSIPGFSRSYILSGVSRADIWLASDYCTLGMVPV